MVAFCGGCFFSYNAETGWKREVTSKIAEVRY